MTSSNDMITDNKKQHRATIGVLIVLILLFIGLAGIWVHHLENRYTHFVTADNATELQNQINYNGNNRLTILMDFRSGCARCNSIHNQIIEQIKKSKNNPNFNFVMADSAKSSNRNYLLKHGILDTPTVTAIVHGYVVEQYSGTNATKFNQLLSGHSLQTNQPIDAHKTPITAFIENDTLNSSKTVSITSHKELNYNL